MKNPKLASITIYPIKSLRGSDLNSAIVERKGIEHDRQMMVIDSDGMFLTQREHARMALIKPVLQENLVILTAPEMNEIRFEVQKSGRKVMAEIWNSKNVESVDQGNLVAEWLSDFLKMPARLVRMADEFQRKVSPEFALQPDDHVSFADGYPILIISQESLDDLNRRLEYPIPMNRFRPNIVVSGVEPFAEDSWKRIRVGLIEMALVKPCARCNVPTIDQDTAESSKEPNQILAQFRKFNGKVMFGVNVIPITTGEIKTGDSVQFLST